MTIRGRSIRVRPGLGASGTVVPSMIPPYGRECRWRCDWRGRAGLRLADVYWLGGLFLVAGCVQVPSVTSQGGASDGGSDGSSSRTARVTRGMRPAPPIRAVRLRATTAAPRAAASSRRRGRLHLRRFRARYEPAALDVLVSLVDYLARPPSSTARAPTVESAPSWPRRRSSTGGHSRIRISHTRRTTLACR